MIDNSTNDEVMYLNENVKQQYAQSIPIAIKPKFKQEFDRLEELHVLKKVQGPTDWVSSLVNVVKPSGELHVCIDPQHLNTAPKREHYPLPVIDDVLLKLAKDKIFSKADCRG